MGLATAGAVARPPAPVGEAPVGEAPVEIHGHRGARGLWPENTLPAFERALALGVDAVELDVGLTRDGVPVVHHDRRLDPDHTRDRSGAWLAPPGPLLRTLDLEALAAFDVGRAAPGGETAKRFPRQAPCDGARVPALGEVLALAQRAGGRRFRFNIEIKLRRRRRRRRRNRRSSPAPSSRPCARRARSIAPGCSRSTGACSPRCAGSHRRSTSAA